MELVRSGLIGVVISTAAVAVMGCSQQRNPLRPASTETPAAGIDDAIVARGSGVTLVAAAEGWHDQPSILDDVTPLWVWIENGSGRPVQVRPANFRLVESSGRQYGALSLDDVEGEALVSASPGFGIDIPRPYTPYYPGFDVYPPDAGYDSELGYGDYGGSYEGVVTVPLPTSKMLQRALPQGTLDPGGYVGGYLYFPMVSDEQSRRLVLTYDLVDAETGESLDIVELSFRVVD